ncbi:MAG TPA: hypothetical protein VM840_13280 [Actinomycetota bacterium]|nr:hypothetical protein [Actinomycetota bacterium]
MRDAARLRLLAGRLPIRLRTLLAIELAYRRTPPNPTPVEKPIRDAATAIVTRTAPGPVKVRVFVSFDQPGVIGWTDGHRGVVGVWLRRTWRQRLHALGASEVERTFVIKPGWEPGDHVRGTEALRWMSAGDGWEAVAFPIEIEEWEGRWTLKWL